MTGRGAWRTRVQDCESVGTVYMLPAEVYRQQPGKPAPPIHFPTVSEALTKPLQPRASIFTGSWRARVECHVSDACGNARVLCGGLLDFRRSLSTIQSCTLQSGYLTCLSSQIWPSKQSTPTCLSASLSSQPSATHPAHVHAHTLDGSISVVCSRLWWHSHKFVPICVRFRNIIVADTGRNGTPSLWKSGNGG